jgi:hypothetical protein
MNALVIRAAERRITAPLIGNYPVVHHATHDAQHRVVKEEVWNKARWIEGHREKVAMRAAVRLVAVGLEISQENRPKRASAGIDQGPCKMFSEYAIAPVLDRDDLVLNLYQLAFSVTHQSGRPGGRWLAATALPSKNRTDSLRRWPCPWVMKGRGTPYSYRNAETGSIREARQAGRKAASAATAASVPAEPA